MKKRLQVLGLYRKGPMVTYSPVSQVQHAIEVCQIYTKKKELNLIEPQLTGRVARMQQQHRISSDVDGTKTEAWPSCKKVRGEFNICIAPSLLYNCV